MDVLSANFEDNTIAWYANDGQGNFSAKPDITTTADGAYSVYAADLDGDGDMDVLSASYADDTIAWYENTGGLLDQIEVLQDDVNQNEADSAAADAALQADVDQVALRTAEASFASKAVITDDADNGYSVYTADLDGDGDMDVLSASADDNTIAWYENDGSEVLYRPFVIAPPLPMACAICLRSRCRWG